MGVNLSDFGQPAQPMGQNIAPNMGQAIREQAQRSIKQAAMQYLQNGGNLTQLSQLLANDPGVQHRMQAMQAQAQQMGMSMQDFILQAAKQNGKDPNQVLQEARQLGYKI